MSRIILGTAQFGMAYGMRNKRGQIPEDEASEIFRAALETGIDALDTAIVYGDSERRIGRFHSLSGKKFALFSKWKDCRAGKAEVCIRESLSRLGVSALEGCLIHQFSEYLENECLFDELAGLKKSGIVRKVGFSIYHPSELEIIFEKKPAVDLIQFPMNVFDQRFVPHLSELRRRGIESQARSLFLQGLVFESPDALPEFFEGVRPKLQRLHGLAASHGTTVHSLCLRFVAQHPLVSSAVIGIDGFSQFSELIRARRDPELDVRTRDEIGGLAHDDERVTVPVFWQGVQR